MRFFFLFLILLLSLCLRLYKLDSFGIWWDEKFTLLEANGIGMLFPGPASFFNDGIHSSNTISGTIHANIVNDGGNGILYSLFMHFWILVFGNSDFSIRLPSVLFDCIFILTAFLFSRRIFRNEKTALLICLILAVHPLLLAYAQQARMYSLGLLLSFLSTAYFYHLFIEEPNRTKSGMAYAAYTALTTAALFTHYFTIYIFLAQAVYLLIYERKKNPWIRFFSCNLIVAFFLMIWMINGGIEGFQVMNDHNKIYLANMAAMKDHSDNSVLPASLKNIFIGWIQVLLPILGNTLQGAGFRIRQIGFLLLIPAIMAVFSFRRNQAKEGNRFMSLLLMLTLSAPVFATLVAVSSGHILSFVSRYAIFSTPYAVLLIGCGILEWWKSGKPRVIQISAWIVLGVCISASLFSQFQDIRAGKVRRTTNPHRLIAGKITEQSLPNDTIVYPTAFDGALISLYLPGDFKNIQLVDSTDAETVRLKNRNLVFFNFGGFLYRY